MITSPLSSAGDDYDLKVDEQTEKFLELNHALTFFLVTASVGSLGFTLTYAKEQFSKVGPSGWLLLLIGIASLLGLLAASNGIRALMHDQSSFRRHLGYRYQRKSWSHLSAPEQAEWDKVNNSAASARKWAFNLLIGTVVAQALFLFLALAIKGDLPMHHYGEDSTHVVAGKDLYHFEFKNKISGAVITMDVPAVGALEDPQKRLDLESAKSLSREVAHLLRQALE